MTNNKFVVSEEKAVRSEADRISTETRRARREFNGTRRHLALDPRVIVELSKEGHLCFVNDDLKGHLKELEDFGYRYVLNREANTEMEEGTDPEGKYKVRFGTADKDGSPQDIYLMLQPWVFYNEDRETIEAMNGKIDDRIKDGADEDLKNKAERRVTIERK